MSPFNPHNNVTADGVRVTEGLRVLTNNLDLGTVVKDRDAQDYKCCLGRHPDDAGRNLDDRGGRKPAQMKVNGGWFSDHQTAGNHPFGCDMHCRHDHWFDVQLDAGGTTMMNGERLSTRFNGLSAEEWTARHK